MAQGPMIQQYAGVSRNRTLTWQQECSRSIKEADVNWTGMMCILLAFALGPLIGTAAIFRLFSFLHISTWLGLAIFFSGCFRIPDTRSSRHRSHPTNTVARPGRTFTHAMAWGNPAGSSYLPATLMGLRRGRRKRGKRPRRSIPHRAAQESQHRWRCSEMGILDQSSSLLR
jgi:hypothetical protein